MNRAAHERGDRVNPYAGPTSDLPDAASITPPHGRPLGVSVLAGLFSLVCVERVATVCWFWSATTLPFATSLRASSFSILSAALNLAAAGGLFSGRRWGWLVANLCLLFLIATQIISLWMIWSNVALEMLRGQYFVRISIAVIEMAYLYRIRVREYFRVARA